MSHSYDIQGIKPNELQKIQMLVGKDNFEKGKFIEASDIFYSMSTSREFKEFLTLPAYKLIWNNWFIVFKIKDLFCQFILAINIVFLLYYAFQLIIFTDEFAIKNIGFFNHAVAGLSEIIGIIFFCLAVGLVIVVFRGANNQLPLFMIVLLIYEGNP